jgi:hypothetical protein
MQAIHLNNFPHQHIVIVSTKQIDDTSFFSHCVPSHLHVILLFFDKEHILISRRYQLHPASATTQCPYSNTDAHSQKKICKKKSPATVIDFL